MKLLTAEQRVELVRQFRLTDDFLVAVRNSGITEPDMPVAHRAWQFLKDYHETRPELQIELEAARAAQHIPTGSNPCQSSP